MNQETAPGRPAMALFMAEFRNKVNANDKGFEKWLSLFFFYILLLFPGVHLKHRLGKSNTNHKESIVEWYVAIKLLLSILAFSSLGYLSYWPKIIVCWILIALTIETVVNNLLYILANKLFPVPRSYKRVIILSFINYLEIIFNFSYFYAVWELVKPDKGEATLNAVDYLFFSISTGGILGYGNYNLETNEGKILAMIQGLLLLMFFGLFVAYNISLFASK